MTQEPLPNYGLRPAEPSDVDWLIELRRQTMTSYLEQSGFRLSEDAMKQRVLHHFDDIRIIAFEDREVGMIKVARNAKSWMLIQIQILPESQGRGIGTALLGNLLTDARRHRVPLQLSVLKVNPAKSLYERLGFRVTGETADSYEMLVDSERC